jgi:hypothetical protein
VISTRRLWSRVGCISLTLVLMLVALAAPGAAAAAANVWTTPVTLFQTTGYASDPVLVPDSSGDVHLIFWTTPVKTFNSFSPGVLMYARLHNGDWSTPVDVLAAPDGAQLKQPAATIDDAGFLHVVFVAGAGGQVYYSRAHASQAAQSGAWTRPALVSLSPASNGAFAVPVAIAASDGVLHFVYTSRDGKVLYRHSDDRGVTWSSAVTLADDTASGGAADDPRIMADTTGRVFVGWSQFQLPAGWPSTGTYMVASRDTATSWSQELRVSGGNHALMNLASSATGQLYRLWLATADIGEVTGQFSNDGGETWSRPESVAPSLKGGFTGFPPMAYDSAGVLHITPSASGPAKNGIYHLTWNGQSWSPPTFISKGAVGKSSVEEPAMAISRGNQIHVVYEDDFERIWYTSQLASAPQALPEALPPVPVATAVPTPRAAALPTVQPTPVVAPLNTPGPQPTSNVPSVDTSSDLTRVFISAAAPLVLIIAGLLVYRLRKLV